MNEMKQWRRPIVLICLIIGFGLFLYYFNTSLDFAEPGDYYNYVEYAVARVTEIETDTIAPDPDYDYIEIGRQSLVMEITSGPYEGQTVTAINYVERLVNNPAAIGTKLVVYSYDGFANTLIKGYDRSGSLYVLAALFLVLILIFGRRKGATSIFSLVFTLVCIIFLFVPMVIRGMDAIPAATITVMLSAAVTLYAINGWNRKTLVAAAGCILCTLMAGLLAWAVSRAAHISTLNTEEAEQLLYISRDTNLRVDTLLFAGILFSSLGAIMDTAMSITSSVFELNEVGDNMTARDLLRSGMNIGRDIMGTMSNTLILAFTGSSINLFVMYYMYQYPYIQLINMELLVIELIRGLSGSIAVVLSIPVTALLAATAATASSGGLRLPVPGRK